MKYDALWNQPRFSKEYDEPLKRILGKTRLYWDHEGVPPHVRGAFRKVLQCRTPALGAEVFASENGELILYHTCKSRACPSCGYWATKKWIPDRVAALPPVPYVGITFSMPDVLWSVFSENRVLADALPILAAKAIESLVSAKHGLRTGVIAFLHTFQWGIKIQLACAYDGYGGRLANLIWFVGTECVLPSGYSNALMARCGAGPAPHGSPGRSAENDDDS